MAYQILNDRALVKLSGNDIVNFMQNLTTNDVGQNYCYSYMLNNRGRYLFDFFLLNINHEIIIDIAKVSTPFFIQKLNMYKLRAKISIEDISSSYQVVYSNEPLTIENLCCFKDPRSSLLGYHSIINKSNLALLPTESLVDNLYNSHKYLHTIPDGNIDLEYERSIPIEYGGIELKAIDFHKGCYVGQEVIARAKYHGVVRKQLFKIISENNLDNITPSAEILDPATKMKIGRFCSNWNNVGIALINEEKLSGLDQIYQLDNLDIRLMRAAWR